MFYFYSPQQHHQFTDRQHELAILTYAAQELRQGRPHHVAFFGLRKIGKTSLLKEFAYRLMTTAQAEHETVLPIFIDFEEICSSPESFALRYIGHVSYWFQTRGQRVPRPFMNLNSLLLNGPQLMKESLEALANELAKAKPDRSFLLHLAFDFVEDLAQKASLRFLVMLDEFQTIHALANFPEVKDVIAIFRAHLERHNACGYVVAGSAISVMERMLAHTSPLFAQFERLTLAPLDRGDTRELVVKLLPPADVEDLPVVSAEIYHLSGGHPFYVEALCGRLRRWHLLQDLPLTPAIIKQAFVWEVLSPQGRIYDFCRYIYDVSIQRARGYGALVAILQLLAEEEGLTIAEIARRQKVTAATARDYLRWLKEVDLIVEREGEHYYCDPVLRFWVANVAAGVEIAGPPRREVLEEMVRHLDERYQRAATELGLAQESQVRELLRGLAGRQVNGALLGTSGSIQLPAFVHVAPYRSPDGQVEVDALAECDQSEPVEGEERWAVEIKWRGKAAGKKELVALLQKAHTLNARPWFISRSGFTPQARAFAGEHGMLISSRADLERLFGQVGAS
jgi:AAA+ ATPase superfamily predicted ATPase